MMTDISNDAYFARLAIAEAAALVSAPHVLMRPVIQPDGDQWCCLYGEDLQVGVAGFGDTPALACAAFDKAWASQRCPPKRSRPATMEAVSKMASNWRSCGRCRFWLPPSPDDDNGRCHRNPPNFGGGWPSTRPDDWCGQFLPLERDSPPTTIAPTGNVDGEQP